MRRLPFLGAQSIRPGSLIDYCLEVISGTNARQLEPRSLGNATSKLVQSLKRVSVVHNNNYPHDRRHFTAGQPKRFNIVGFTKNGADRTMFLYEDRDNGTSQEVSVEVSKLFFLRYVRPHHHNYNNFDSPLFF